MLWLFKKVTLCLIPVSLLMPMVAFCLQSLPPTLSVLKIVSFLQVLLLP